MSYKAGGSPRYLIFSDGTNALAIARGLRKMNIASQLRRDGEEPVVSPGDCLFFTNEDALVKNLGRQDVHFLPREVTFPIDDKLAFPESVRKCGLLPVPTVALDATKIEVLEYPVVLKSRRSWKSGVKTPKGLVCFSPMSLTRFLAKVASDGWDASDFVVQPYMPDGVSNVVSVCGFFDFAKLERTAVLVCRKLLSRDHGFGSSGSVVITIDDPSKLEAATLRYLLSLKYRGPFELEFIFDADGVAYVLELNPRFWMQHGLFVRFFDNALIKRYLSADRQEDWEKFRILKENMRDVLWIDGFRMAESLYSRDMDAWRYYVKELSSHIFMGRRFVIDPFPLHALFRRIKSKWLKFRNTLR